MMLRTCKDPASTCEKFADHAKGLDGMSCSSGGQAEGPSSKAAVRVGEAGGKQPEKSRRVCCSSVWTVQSFFSNRGYY
jgi:hypothetical protein